MRGSAAPRPADVEDDGREAGVTLVETLVAMSIFVVLMAVVMAVVLVGAKASVRAQNARATSADVVRAFELMDKQVRYADAINFPGYASSAYWVEFRTTLPSATSQTCVQWRYTPSTGQLQDRTWTPGALASTGTWATLLTTTDTTTWSTSASSGGPFTMLPTTTLQIKQELSVSLTDKHTGAAAASLVSTFVARNSSSTSLGNIDVAGDGVSDSPVCAPSGYRS